MKVFILLLLMSNFTYSQKIYSTLSTPFNWGSIESNCNNKSELLHNIENDSTYSLLIKEMINDKHCAEYNVIDRLHYVKLNNLNLLFYNFYLPNSESNMILLVWDLDRHVRILHESGEVIDLNFEAKSIFVKLYVSACCDDIIESENNIIISLDSLYKVTYLEQNIFGLEDCEKYTPKNDKGKSITVIKTSKLRINVCKSHKYKNMDIMYNNAIERLDSNFIISKGTEGLLLDIIDVPKRTKRYLVRVPYKGNSLPYYNDKYNHSFLIGWLEENEISITH